MDDWVTSETWPKILSIVVTAIVCIIIAFIVAVVTDSSINHHKIGKIAVACLQYDRQWIDGNCVK